MYFEFKNLKNIKFKTVEFLVSLVFALTCFFLYLFFPLSLKGDLIEAFLKTLLFLVIFPIAYVKVILKKNLSDLFLNKHHFDLKSNLFLIMSLIVGILSYLIIIKTPFLYDYYTKNIFPIFYFKNTEGFKIFVFYEFVVAFLFLNMTFFSFSFVNLISEKFYKLNRILPILTFYFLFIFSLNKLPFQEYIISFLIILPMIFFRKIVNQCRSIWFFYFLILILNIVFNAIIIKLSL